MAALDLKMRRDMQIELRHMHKELGTTFIYVTHDQEEALVLSDNVVVLRDGFIQQIGSPAILYHNPANAFVANFIGQSNIFDGEMVDDFRVRIAGREFDCMTLGFKKGDLVDVVIRPENVRVQQIDGDEMVVGRVVTSFFKGSSKEMTLETEEGFRFMAISHRYYPVDDTIGFRVEPEGMHIMKKERLCNSAVATVVDSTTIEMLGKRVEVEPLVGFAKGEVVDVEFGFDNITLYDYADQGTFAGNVKFILFKGDHYLLTVKTLEGDEFFVKTQLVWDNGDVLSMDIPAANFRIVKRA